MTSLPDVRPLVLPTPQEAITAARGAVLPSMMAALRGRIPVQRDGRRPPEAVRSVTYLVPRTDVGGGARILFEHVRRLHALAVATTVVAHGPRPAWIDVPGSWVQLPYGLDLAAGIPPCDVVVAGYWDQLPGAVAASVAPVVHFEQGDFHLYDDMAPETAAMVRCSLGRTPWHLAVSGAAARALADRYGIVATVLPNAVDRTVFRAKTPDERACKPSLICVGGADNAFKGIPDVVRAWQRLAAEHPVELTWVTPRPPASLPAGVRVLVNPPQADLAAAYRRAWVYVGASRYESFPLPPMEAMASGTPVVSTDNAGVLEYARQEENALLVPIGDVAALTAAIQRVIDDPDVASRLVSGGLATAARYEWDQVIGELLGSLSRTGVVGDATPPAEWQVHTDALDFDDPTAEELLRGRLGRTPADIVQIPVRQPVLEGHALVRWRTVASRRDPRGTGTDRLWLPAADVRPVADHPFQSAIDALNQARPADALRALDAAVGGASPCTVARWRAIALLEDGQDQEAVALVESSLDRWPEHGDWYYLAALTATLTGRPIDIGAVRTVTQLLRNGTPSHEEWFADLDQLVVRLVDPVPALA